MFLPDPAPCGAVFPPAVSHRRLRQQALQPAERSAVLLAHIDARRSGWEGASPTSAIGGWLRRLFEAATGIEPVQPLADRRLEHLRLFACMMRRGDRRADAVAEGLLRDGFSERALREAVGLALA